MTVIDDIRHAIRLMTRQKAFTAAALVTLALGIGATTAIFSMVYGVLLRPLPYPTSDRLVRLSEAHPGGTPIVRSPVLSNITYYAWKKAPPRTIEGVGGYSTASFTLVHRGSGSRVRGALVAPALFGMLGARPLAGRLLQERDAAPGAPRTVVLSSRFWQEQFGGQESVVGQSIALDGQPHTVVGVAPPDFFFPDRGSRIWAPLVAADTPADARVRIFAALALLRPGATPEQAASEATAIARGTGPRHMSANLLFGTGGPVTITARPLLDEITAGVRPALLVLFASVTLVLLMGCANVANLLLSRGVSRGRELALRAAVGAGRARLARQLMTEALVLSIAGGALGVGLAWLLTSVIPVVAPQDFPRLADVRMDVTALGFAVAASLLAGLLAGVLPATRVSSNGLLPALREGTGASAGARARRIGAVLLMAEAAVAVILLVGAGLLGRSFVRLVAVDPGFDAANVLMARVYAAGGDAGAGARDGSITQVLLERIRALPGVTAAGASNMAPFVPMTAMVNVTLRGDSAEPITARALWYGVTTGYGEAVSLRLREGRFFEPRDVAAGIRPLVINEEFARVHFGDGRSPIGRRFTTSFEGHRQVEIIGVVRNVLKDGLDTAPQPEMHSLSSESPRAAGLNLAVRTSGDPLALIPALLDAVRATDRTAALDDVATLGSRLSASVSEPRFAVSVLMALAVAALLLAAVGLYGVLSYQVSRRRREMGVRAALGASRGSLVGLVMRDGLAVTAAGVGIGLIAAAWLSRLIAGMLFGVTPHDALVFGVAPVVLIAVAVVATLVPARRAASIDPIEALRCE